MIPGKEHSMLKEEHISTEARRFNIRVYGLCINDGWVLITDEFRLGIYMTKFPGGALEFGEGTIDCLRREFREELRTEIGKIAHYYTTDFYQPTTLLPSNMQLLNIYYLVTLLEPYGFQTTNKRFDIPAIDGAQAFRRLRVKELTEAEFTFPIDQYLVSKLKSDFS